MTDKKNILDGEIDRQLSHYVDERKWPTFWHFHDALKRLRQAAEQGIPPAIQDIGLAGAAVNLFRDLSQRLGWQRLELAKLNEERDKGWRADGVKAIWLKQPNGKTLVTVLVGRNVVGLITPDYSKGSERHPRYQWSAGPDSGDEWCFGAALNAVSVSWRKRSKLETPQVYTGWIPVSELPPSDLGAFIVSNEVTGLTGEGKWTLEGHIEFMWSRETVTHWQRWPSAPPMPPALTTTQGKP